MKKRRGTKLWFVWLRWENYAPVVYVSAKAPKGWPGRSYRFRSLTARAAGRRFIRNNLANIIASAECESYVYGERATKKEEKIGVVQRYVRQAKLCIV